MAIAFNKPKATQTATIPKRSEPDIPAQPRAKKLLTLRMDEDVIEAFRATGKGWQARMNDALRKAKP